MSLPNPNEVYVPGVTPPGLMSDDQIAAEIAHYIAEGQEIVAEYQAMGEDVDPSHGAAVCGGNRWRVLAAIAAERGLVA